MMFKFTKKLKGKSKNKNNKDKTSKKTLLSDDVDCCEESTIATSTSVHENDNSNHHNPKRHRVRFNPKNASYRHTLAISDMSIEEKDSYWITPIEFAESKNQSAMILRMMMKCHSENQQQLQETDEICCRGLGKFDCLAMTFVVIHPMDVVVILHVHRNRM